MSTRYTYTANGWGYCHAQDAGDVYRIIERLAQVGCQGFDLLVGPEAFPRLSMDELAAQGARMRAAALPLASIFLVSFGLQDVGACIADLRQAVAMAGQLAVTRICLLPRKIGISRQTAFANMRTVWRETRQTVQESGITLAAENHIWTDDADTDVFLLRTEADQQAWLDITQGEIGLKFDPAWLLKAGADPVAVLRRLLPHVAVLDVKDYKGGQFVTPGTGQVNFAALREIIAPAVHIHSICVECEAHHHLQPPLTSADAIDALQKSDFEFYRKVFG